MHSLKTKLKRGGLFLTVLTLFATMLAGGLGWLMPKSANAQATQFSPEQQALAYEVGWALGQCSDRQGWNGELTRDELAAGMIFYHTTGGDSHQGFAGHLLYPEDGPDGGYLNCEAPEQVKAALAKVGVTDLVDFFQNQVKIYYYDSSIQKFRPFEKEYDFYPQDLINKDGSISNNERRNFINRYLDNKFGGLDFASKPSKAIQHAQLLASFSKICSPREDAQNGTAVKVVENGQDIEKKYTYNPISGKVGGWIEGSIQLGGDDIGLMSCEQIITALNNTFEDYAKVVKANAGDNNPGNDSGGIGGGGGTLTGGTGDNSNTTCETSRFSLNWIMCGIFNMFGEGTEFFYKQILQKFLISPPVDTNPNSPSFQAWSGFRIYGNIILVIAMIVIVFSQAIGGGLVDAYTAKKVMPRILVAAILINLSVYIVAFLVDATNILGKGISDLMLSPFGNLGVTPDGSQQAGAGLVLFSLALLGAGGFVGFLGALIFGGAGTIAVMVALTVVVPAFIAIMAVFVTLVIRRGIILALILASPVAFALYCLPNTEKYFRKWWELLFKTLLVYPIIMMIFAVSNIMTLTIMNGNKGAGAGDFSSGIAGIIAFSLQIIPLFLIPFAFKFAGGAISTLYAAVTGGSQKISGALKSRQDIARRDAKVLMDSQRRDAVNSVKAFGNRGGRVRSAISRFGVSRIGGYDIEAAMAGHREETKKRIRAKLDNGVDTEERAAVTNRVLLDAARGGVEELRRSDFVEGRDWKVDEDGNISLANVGGNFYKLAEVETGVGRYGNDETALQAIIEYEYGKDLLPEQKDRLKVDLPELARSMRIRDDAFNGVLVGSGFGVQGFTRTPKRRSMGRDGRMHLNANATVDEHHGKIGTYQAYSLDGDDYTDHSAIHLEALSQQQAATQAAQAAQAQLAINPQDAQAQADLDAAMAQMYASSDILTKQREIIEQFKGMTPQQIQAQVQQAATASGATVSPGAAAGTAKAIQEFIATVEQGTMVQGGLLEDRLRRTGGQTEVIDIRKDPTSVQNPRIP